MLTIPLLVTERVVDWAVRKGYLEFEHHPQAACAGDRADALAEHACGSAPVTDAVACVSRCDAGGANSGGWGRRGCVSLFRPSGGADAVNGDNAHQQLGSEALSSKLQQTSNELQRVSRYLIESQEYCTFLEAKLEQGEGTSTRISRSKSAAPLRLCPWKSRVSRACLVST
jgi:hypothetical protein